MQSFIFQRVRPVVAPFRTLILSSGLFIGLVFSGLLSGPAVLAAQDTPAERPQVGGTVPDSLRPGGQQSDQQNPPAQVPDVLSGGPATQQPATQPQQPDAQQAAAAAAQAQQAQAQREQAVAQLVNEIASLVPGEVPPDSPAGKILLEAATAFANQDLVTVKEKLESARAADTAFPPAGLLLSAMLFAVNDAAGGRATLEETAIENPEFPGIFLAFARLAVNQDRHTDALALLDKSVLLIQKATLTDVEDRHYKGLYYDMSAELALRQLRLPDAKLNIERLKEVDPSNDKIQTLAAEIEFEEGNFDGAIALLQEYSARTPATQAPELIIASWLQDRGRVEEIGPWVDKAGTKYPENAAVQLEYANYCVNQERFPDANSAVSRVEKLTGESPATMLLKAKMAFASEAYGLAESYYERLAKSQAQAFDAANMYALSMIESESEDKRKLARQIAEANFRQMPDNRIAQAAFGWILFRLGDEDNALALLSRATNGNQLPPEIAFFAATVMRDQGRVEEAIEILKVASESKGFYHYRSRAKRLLKELESNENSELPAPSDDK